MLLNTKERYTSDRLLFLRSPKVFSPSLYISVVLSCPSQPGAVQVVVAGGARGPLLPCVSGAGWCAVVVVVWWWQRVSQ